MTGEPMEADELAGRGGLLAVLSDVITAAAESGDAVLLVGEPGIGRTACLLAAGAMARTAGHQVLEAAGLEAETQLSFAGLHRLIRPLLQFADRLPEVQRSALLSVFGMHDGGRGDRFVVSIATVNLLRHAAEHRPLVITTDDFQWLDDETQHVLAFVARRLDRRLVMIATSPSHQSVPGLRAKFRALHLERLDETTARGVLVQRAPGLDPTHREWVLNNALGNPLALIELAKASAPAVTTNVGPLTDSITLNPSLHRAFSGGLGDLSKSGRDVLLVAALASEASLPEILAATARMLGQRVTPAVLEPAQALGLLTFDETRVTFTHPLVKAAIVQKEPISRRQTVHRSLGAVITVNSNRRAWHRARGTAGYDDVIAAELEATTADSVRRGDTAAAAMALERAAQLSTAPVERGRRLLLAARLAARMGRPDEVDRLMGGVVTSELSGFDRVRAELLRENFGGILIDDNNRITQLCTIAEQAIAAGETGLAIELADTAVRRRCAAPVDPVALAQLAALARTLHRSGGAGTVAVLALADPIGHGRAVLSVLAELEESLTNDGDELTAYGVAARAVGHYSLASKLLDRAEIPLRARGLLGSVARNLCVIAELHIELGEWERAATALDSFRSLSDASMSTSHRATALTTTAKFAALRGDNATALQLVSEIEHSPHARSGSRYLARAQIVRGVSYLSSDKHLEAFIALSRVFDPSDPSHHFREQYDAVAYFAEAAARAGRQDQARRVIEHLQLIADVSGAPVLLTHLLYARAILAPDTVAERIFIAGLASEAAGSPWQRARIQLAYGCWLRRHQRVTESRRPLQAALTILERLGAQRWAREALDELEAAGAHSERERDLLLPNLLSVQELKIARLASHGLSNKEIGRQCHLSSRTVSSHLYRIFPKLGISARSQIASRLDETYPVSDSV